MNILIKFTVEFVFLLKSIKIKITIAYKFGKFQHTDNTIIWEFFLVIPFSRT